MPCHKCQDQERRQGECRVQRHRAQDAQRCPGAGQTLQGLRYEKVSAKYEQRAQETHTGQK